ncbi:MAG: glycosyltransferase [Coleofasciculus sp. S288]|nr:glycosyltransferase [Coleofasciculus sp. S288]
MSNSLSVSIIINNYNYGQFLSDAINSALNQTYSNFEVVVVDDGSTDHSRDIIASYKDEIVPVLKENGGQASAFNAGFAASKGDIICFLDADDIFIPEKAEEIAKIFERHLESGWCFHPLRLVDENVKTLLEINIKDPSRECDFRSHIKDKGKLPFSAPATSGLCFRRSLLEQILPMSEAKDVSLGDHYLKFTALALSKGFFLNQKLALQRLHNTNAYTQRTDKQQLKARILMFTAYAMRMKFPSLTKFTNKIFARGMSTYWRDGNGAVDLKDVLHKYLTSVSPFEKFEIQSRAFYRYFFPEEL